MNLKRFASIPVLAVVALLGFVYYVIAFVFADHLLSSFVFTLLSSLCFFSFAVCVLADPGHVPASYAPDLEHSLVPNSSQPMRCDKCSAFKPPRAHHCRVCKTCVLRMDHHCKWINNCVGYWNYKAYFMLVFYATMGSIYSTVIIISSALQKDWAVSGTTQLKLFYVAFGFMTTTLSLTLGTLLGWHVYLIIRNMTTIEHYEAIRAKWMAKKSGQNYRHLFDLGAYKNITSVLGPNVLKWPFPNSVSHLKDGLTFPISRNNL